MHISIATHIIFDFPVRGGGSGPPIPALDPRMVLIAHLGKKRIISLHAHNMGSDRGLVRIIGI